MAGGGSCAIKKDRRLGKGECPKKIRFLFIRELSVGHRVAWLCQIANVSRAGYYKWLKRQGHITAKDRENQELQTLLRSGYLRHRGRYGYRRMQVWLNRQTGQTYNHKRVYRLLDIIGLKARIRRRKRWYGQAAEAGVVLPNLLNRRFEADAPNQRWVSDITCLPGPDRTLYLSAIKDLATNEIVAYRISDRNDLKLVRQTLLAAIRRQRKKVYGILIHSDQGFQYTSKSYQKLLQRYGMQASMSRKGNCLDNAAMESFFSHLKTELLYLEKFASAVQLKRAVRSYIRYYNEERIQIKLNKLAPVAYRRQLVG
jgi:putative transposase